MNRPVSGGDVNSPPEKSPGFQKKRIAKFITSCYNSPCVRSKDDAPTLGCRQAVRHQTLTLTFVGSNPAIPAKYDPLAQSAEQLPFKQWVRSSNLRRVTKKAHALLGMCFFALSIYLCMPKIALTVQRRKRCSPRYGRK